MGFWKGVGKVLNKVKGVALPVIGTALGGPLGGALGGALAGGIGHGKPQLKRIGAGAALGGIGGALGGGQAGARAILGGGVKQALANPVATGGRLLTGGSGATAPPTAPTSLGVGGMLKKAGGFALDNPELIAGGLSFLEGRDNERKADRYRNKALGLLEQEYAAKAPLRSNALSILQREPPPQLPRYRGQNPFGR